MRFVQTSGGQIGLAVPRFVRGKGYVQLGSTVVWTTLQLVIYADGQARGSLVTRQGASEVDLFLLLDGVLEVEVDGKTVARLGAGAILGEQAALEHGVRTATLRAVTPCRLVVVSPAQISRYARGACPLARA